jgi:murein DD-endopeptidase MepM/ murein hydrolase activator NlpD
VAFDPNAPPDKETGETVRGFKCKPEIVGNRWEMAHGDTKIVRNGGAFAEADAVPAVTMGSFLVCRHGGLIEPVTSGRENRETAPKGFALSGYEGAGRTVSRSALRRTPLAASLSEFPLQKGSSGDAVRLLQIALIAKLHEMDAVTGGPKPNNDTGKLKIDGDFGDRTLAAINDYKDRVMPGGNTESSGYRGLVGLQAWTSLGLLPAYNFEADTTLKRGSSNDKTLVQVLQTTLKERGLYSGAIDGVFDGDLESSINTFKNQMHLGNTGEFKGKVGKQTWEYLGLSLGYNEPYLAPLTRPVAMPLPVAAVTRVSSEYMDTEYHDHTHKGIDLPATTGTPILAVAPGMVTKVDSGGHSSRGKYVTAEHIIDGRKITATYQHNNRNLVNVGDRVTPGDQIATVGNTGTSGGSHLHIEFEENGNYISARQVLPRLPI